MRSFRAAPAAVLTSAVLLALVALVALVACGPAAAGAAPASPTVSPRVLYVHNDSGDRARFFALDAGTRLAVRTDTTACLRTVRDADVATALRSSPMVVALPDQRQGEGIAFAGDRLLLDSEGTGTAVLSLALPRAAGASTSRPASSPSSRSARPSGSPTPTGSYGGGGSWVPGIVVLTLFVLGAIGWWVAQRGGDGRRAER